MAFNHHKESWTLVTQKRTIPPSQPPRPQPTITIRHLPASLEPLGWIPQQFYTNGTPIQDSPYTYYQQVIIALTQKGLARLNYSSLSTFVDPFILTALLDPLWYNKDATPGVYFLEITRGNRALLVGVRISFTERLSKGGKFVAFPGFGANTSGNIPMALWFQSTGPGSLLASLPSDIDDVLGEQGYRKQSDWLGARGPICDFPALPEEIQDVLLLHMVGEVQEIMCTGDREPGYMVGTRPVPRYDINDDPIYVGRAERFDPALPILEQVDPRKGPEDTFFEGGQAHGPHPDRLGSCRSPGLWEVPTLEQIAAGYEGRRGHDVLWSGNEVAAPVVSRH